MEVSIAETQANESTVSMIRIHVEVYIACTEIVPRIQGEFPNIACQLLQCELFSFTVAGLPALAAAMTHPDFGDDSTRSVLKTINDARIA